MSGSSLDGLDVAICRFALTPEGEIADWEILAAVTDPYPPAWRARLKTAPNLPGRELWRLHADLGDWFGRRIAAFLEQHPTLKPSLAGSHGHTVFHDPDRRFTTQLGDGAYIAGRLRLPTVSELRSADVASGGLGAPLAPVADHYLFPDYDAFLNLGGIANLNVRRTDGSVAGDVSGCCQILDRLAELEGQAFDRDGEIARGGKFRAGLAERIGGLAYHARPYPKALANDWVRDVLWPVLDGSAHSPADRLNTFVKWLAASITADISFLRSGPQRVLVTGGGANNGYLLEQLNLIDPKLRFVVPSRQVADFKEAALVALCALLRVQGRPNSFAAATGAPQNTINGALYLPPY